MHHLSPRGTVQARDGGLLEEVQREEEAERSHLDHHACLEELLKYVQLITINITLQSIFVCSAGAGVVLANLEVPEMALRVPKSKF